MDEDDTVVNNLQVDKIWSLLLQMVEIEYPHQRWHITQHSYVV